MLDQKPLSLELPPPNLHLQILPLLRAQPPSGFLLLENASSFQWPPGSFVGSRTPSSFLGTTCWPILLALCFLGPLDFSFCRVPFLLLQLLFCSAQCLSPEGNSLCTPAILALPVPFAWSACHSQLAIFPIDLVAATSLLREAETHLLGPCTPVVLAWQTCPPPQQGRGQISCCHGHWSLHLPAGHCVMP